MSDSPTPLQLSREPAHALRTMRVGTAHEAGLTGAGVAVAVIDTGVEPSPGLGDRLKPGINLSGFGEDDDTRDGFGHGTFVAGLIAGDGNSPEYDAFEGGVAPGAEIVPVRVAAPDGSTDVGSVVAAIQWCVAHRSAPGRSDIGVINLSFGMDGPGDWRISPLAYACERAWQAGIVVVVSVGNDPERPLTTPGHHPMLLTVGSSDTGGTAPRFDDTVDEQSASAVLRGRVKPDVVAPGEGLVSYRVPDGFLHRELGSGEPSEHYSRATGTSFAAAYVSGIAALLIDRDSSFTPDVVKDIIVGTSVPLLTHGIGQGAGQVDAGAAAAVDPTTLGGTRVHLPENRPELLGLAAARSSLEVGRYRVDAHGVPQADDDHGIADAETDVHVVKHEVHTHDLTDDRGWDSPEGWAEVWRHDEDHRHTTYWPDKPWAQHPAIGGEAFEGHHWWGHHWWGHHWWGHHWWGHHWWGHHWWGHHWW